MLGLNYSKVESIPKLIITGGGVKSLSKSVPNYNEKQCWAMRKATTLAVLQVFADLISPCLK